MATKATEMATGRAARNRQEDGTQAKAWKEGKARGEEREKADDKVFQK